MDTISTPPAHPAPPGGSDSPDGPGGPGSPGSPGGPGGEDATRPRHRALEAITKYWLPFFTGLLALATAAVGLYAKQATDERDELADSSSSLEAQVAQLSDRKDELEASNEQLQADNDALREQVESAQSSQSSRGSDDEDSSTPTTSPTAPSEPPAVFRATSGTPVVVAEYSGIDLDSQDSNWGIESDSRDLYVSGGADHLNVSDTLAIVDAPPTVAQCEAQTVRDEHLDRSQTVVGQQLCVRSGEGRWAYVRIASIDTEAKTISFEITVWKLPSDP